MSAKNFACVCGGGIGNLGVPSCVERPGLAQKDIFVNTFANDGTRNSIKSSDLVNGKLTSSFILARLTDPDPSKRWYITPDEMEVVDPSRTDRTVQEGETGTQKVLRNGVKTYSYQLWEVPDSWAANMNRGLCNEVSVYKVDEAASLSGEVSDDGLEFYPLRIQRGSLNAEPFDAKSAEDAYTMITYQLSRLVNEGAYLTLSASNIEENILEAESLIDIDLTQNQDNSNTPTEVYVDAFNCIYGSFGDPLALRGAVDTADWTVSNNGAPVTVSSVEEYESGKYRITIDSSPSATLSISFVKVKSSISEIGYIAESLTVQTPA